MFVVAKTARERTAPLANAIAASIPKPIPLSRCVGPLELGALSVTTQATPKIVNKIPYQARMLSSSCRKISARIAVTGGAKVSISKARRAPRQFKAAKKAVSPKPMPTTPLSSNKERAVGGIAGRKSLLRRRVKISRAIAIVPLSKFNSNGEIRCPKRPYTNEDTAHKKAAHKAASSPLKSVMR